MHVLNHKGKYLSVRGPLNIARPVQGWPVIVQAGASEAGRQLAAETAEAVFTAQSSLAVGQQFYADVKGRAEKAGRARDHIKILPGCFVVVGETVEEARRSGRSSTAWCTTPMPSARCRSRSATMRRSSIRTGRCRTSPRATPARADGSARSTSPKRENLTVRQLAQRLGGYSGLAMVGTPKTIADEMEEWLATEGSDGFTVMFPYLPGGLDDFVNGVIPELQRRGLFRREYEGRTLRENLGLPRPKNRFF